MDELGFFPLAPARMPSFSKTKFKKGAVNLILSKKKIVGEIAYIFCSDEELIFINRKYLSHDTYTDVITFDYTEKRIISGDIFISVERVKENAKTYNVTFKQELIRVMVHGILHLFGLKDKSLKEEKKMRKAEDDAIKKYFSEND
jgi:rRNA maturation RNase YbeY